MEQIFKSTKTLLQEIVEQAGHKVIAKQYSRQNCNFSWESLNQIVPDALNSVSLSKIRKFARRCYSLQIAVKKNKNTVHVHQKMPISSKFLM